MVTLNVPPGIYVVCPVEIDLKRGYNTVCFFSSLEKAIKAKCDFELTATSLAHKITGLPEDKTIEYQILKSE